MNFGPEWDGYMQTQYGDGTKGGGNTSTQIPPCEHNKISLAYPKVGTIRGFSGPQHLKQLKELKGINLFLNSPPWSREYLYANFKEAFPKDPPKEKVLYFHIPDQGVPSDLAEFAILIDLLMKEIKKGGQVNVSCIGGHGRTGLILAILHGLLTKSKEPFKDIREQYCKKAVESYAQECFIHKWLGLPKPIEVVKPCAKCQKEPRMVHPDGRKDVWCEKCDREWTEENVKKNAVAKTSAPIIPFIGKMLSKGDNKKCNKCWVRDPQPGSLWCLTCSFDLQPKDIPQTKPDGWSKNAWKRMLKSIQGHSHSPSMQPNKVDNALLVETLKSEEDMQLHAQLKEIPIQQMTDEQWAAFLRLEFGRNNG